MKVELIGYMQVNPDYIYDHDWHTEVSTEDPEWLAASAMRSCKTEKEFHTIMDENNMVPCPVCKGTGKLGGKIEELLDYPECDIQYEECWFCEGQQIIPIVSKRIYDSLMMGHYTVAGMTEFMFLISNISRAMTHQLVRHRMAWYLQLSQRAVNPVAKNDWYIVPETISNKPDCLQRYMELVDLSKATYKYFRKRKVPLEDARYALIEGCKTRIVMKIDGSNLLHFLKLRTHPSAQWEIRAVAERVHHLVGEICPTLFDKNLKERWW